MSAPVLTSVAAAALGRDSRALPSLHGRQGEVHVRLHRLRAALHEADPRVARAQSRYVGTVIGILRHDLLSRRFPGTVIGVMFFPWGVASSC